MTNREKWFMAMTDRSVVDALFEDFICTTFVTPTLGEACPGCPLGSLCRSYVNEERTFEQYMEAVTDWLDKEVEDSVFEKESALKLIDSLVSVNDTLRREIIMSDAVMSIGKET